MSETETVATPVEPPRRRPGRPPRTQRVMSKEQVTAAADRAETPSIFSKMKARPNWESDDFVGVGLEQGSRLHIPTEIVQRLYQDGGALQWITKSNRGMDMPQELAKMTRGGWTPVFQSDFDGLFDGMFMPKGDDSRPITVDDCMLVIRPVELQEKAYRAMRRDANLPLQIAEEQIGHGIPGVTGSTHPTALMGNRIKKSMERVEIPE